MRHTHVLWLSVAVLAVLMSGCVHRELAIKSTPADATIELDGRVLSELTPDGQTVQKKTPVALPFFWYGTHKIVVKKDGYDPAVRIVHLRPPWYEQFPIDFFADLVIPWTIHDNRECSVVLVKADPVGAKSAEEKQALKTALLARADTFRAKARERLAAQAEEDGDTEKTTDEAKPTEAK